LLVFLLVLTVICDENPFKFNLLWDLAIAGQGHQDFIPIAILSSGHINQHFPPLASGESPRCRRLSAHIGEGSALPEVAR
jgi:hypothetical protein